MDASTNPDETPAVPPMPDSVSSQAQVTPTVLQTLAANPSIPPTARVRRAGRTLLITGFLIIMFFFSPFVSCGSRTMTGVEAFQVSLPTSYSEPKDGIFIIIFPIIGALSALVGFMVTQRLASGVSLAGLRALSVSALVLALLTICPIAIGFIDVQSNQGRLTLEWGFYGSLFSSFAMIWAGFELLTCTSKRVTAAVEQTCPGCGTSNPVSYRFCARCGDSLDPPNSET